jgi:serine/threonine protein kinase
LLGKGGFGKVYKALNHLDRREYAVKKVVMKGDTLSESTAKGKAEELLSELRALARLNHQNIGTFWGAKHFLIRLVS